MAAGREGAAASETRCARRSAAARSIRRLGGGGCTSDPTASRPGAGALLRRHGHGQQPEHTGGRGSRVHQRDDAVLGRHCPAQDTRLFCRCCAASAGGRPGLNGSLGGPGLLAPRPRGRAPLYPDRRGRRGQASSRSCRGASTSRAGGARGASGWRTLSARALPTGAGTGWATPRRWVPSLPKLVCSVEQDTGLPQAGPPSRLPPPGAPAGCASARSAPRPATAPPALHPSSCLSTPSRARMQRGASAGAARVQVMHAATKGSSAPPRTWVLQLSQPRYNASASTLTFTVQVPGPRLRTRLHPCVLSCTAGCGLNYSAWRWPWCFHGLY